MSKDKTLRERILAVDDIGSEMVDIPEWGEKIEVRGLTAAQMRRVSAADGETRTGPFLVASCYDPDSGEQVFDPADADQLEQKSSSAIQRLLRTANLLNGWGDEADREIDAELGKAEAASADTS